MLDCGSKLIDFSVLVGRVKRLKSSKVKGVQVLLRVWGHLVAMIREGCTLFEVLNL